MSFLDGQHYSANVHAIAETELICIERQAFDAIIADDERLAPASSRHSR
jgi:CRP-like cAMP-binding protein